MLNPHFVAGEHGLFGGHKSEDIRTFLFYFRLTQVGRNNLLDDWAGRYLCTCRYQVWISQASGGLG